MVTREWDRVQCRDVSVVTSREIHRCAFNDAAAFGSQRADCCQSQKLASDIVSKLVPTLYFGVSTRCTIARQAICGWIGGEDDLPCLERVARNSSQK